jgi:hypothetical protein
LGGSFLLLTADREAPTVQRGGHNIEHELIFPSQSGYVFHDSRGFESGSEEELEIVQDFVRRKSRESQLKDKLHAIWSVPLGIHSGKFTTEGFTFQVLHLDGQ